MLCTVVIVKLKNLSRREISNAKKYDSKSRSKRPNNYGSNGFASTTLPSKLYSQPPKLLSYDFYANSNPLFDYAALYSAINPVSHYGEGPCGFGFESRRAGGTYGGQEGKQEGGKQENGKQVAGKQEGRQA
jgi:hypothetical protein